MFSHTIGAAQLLRTLRALPKGAERSGLETALSEAFGLSYADQQQKTDAPNPQAEQADQDTQSTPAVSADSATSERPAPSFIPIYWHLESVTAKTQQQSDVLPVNRSQKLAESTDYAVLPEPTVPECWQRGDWQNLWDRVLKNPNPGQPVDWPKLHRQLSQAKPLCQLPRLPQNQVEGRTLLLLDLSQQTRPVWKELQQARAHLQALVGMQVQVHELRQGPEAPWLPPLSASGTDSLDELSAQAQVICIGAFGAYDAPDMDVAQNAQTSSCSAPWARLFRRLQQYSKQLTLLSLTPVQVPEALTAPPNSAQLHCLDQRSTQYAPELLQLLAPIWWCSLSQLRDMRLALGQQGKGAGLADELLVWNCAQVHRQAGYLQVPADLRQSLLQQPQSHDTSDSSNIQGVMARWAASQCPENRQLEGLLAQLTADQLAEKNCEALLQLALGADRDIQHGALGTCAEKMHYMLADFHALTSAHPQLKQHHSAQKTPVLAQILRVAQRLALAAGQALPLGSQGLSGTGQRYQLYQSGQQLALAPMDGPLEYATALCTLDMRPYIEQTQRQMPVNGTLDASHPQYQLEDEQHCWQLSAQTKPHWADTFARNAHGLQASHTSGAQLHWANASVEQPKTQWQLQPASQPHWAAQMGVDTYGLWADIALKGATQRLRWVPPGGFWMGSPEGEVDRYDDETLHYVEHTQGYWLADTACTQALWQAVMGENPSHFQSLNQATELPVEKVSWKDCQTFVDKANALLGLSEAEGFVLRLPTEAEWERACRAGTHTAFSWGNRLSTEQANYDGNYPYVEGAKGEYREQTLPVRTFATNNWGFYQMHGNVLEWCADGFAAYAAGSAEQPLCDPIGAPKADKDESRVLRGGCWLDRGRHLRAAFRRHFPPHGRDRSIGVRLAAGRPL